jgi:hypothetical protein
LSLRIKLGKCRVFFFSFQLLIRNRTERALDRSGISIAPPKRQRNTDSDLGQKPIRPVSARVRRSDVVDSNERIKDNDKCDEGIEKDEDNGEEAKEENNEKEDGEDGDGEDGEDGKGEDNEEGEGEDGEDDGSQSYDEGYELYEEGSEPYDVPETIDNHSNASSKTSKAFEDIESYEEPTCNDSHDEIEEFPEMDPKRKKIVYRDPFDGKPVDEEFFKDDQSVSQSILDEEEGDEGEDDEGLSFGASRTIGGLFRGRAKGNIGSITDFRKLFIQHAYSKINS